MRAGPATATPPVVSLWPPMYLVAECTTTSAPNSMGRQIAGEAKVESTTSEAPASCAICASAGRSETVIVGLDSVSVKTTRVSGRTAARTASGSVTSTKSVLTPKRRSSPSRSE